MRAGTVARLGVVIAISWLGALGQAPLGRAQSEEIVVAAFRSTTTTTLNADVARAMLSGRVTHWPDGTPVVLVLPARGTPEAVWLARFTGMPEVALRRFILQQVFRGRLTRPAEPSTRSGVLSEMARRRGALGVVTRSAATGLCVVQIR